MDVGFCVWRLFFFSTLAKPLWAQSLQIFLCFGSGKTRQELMVTNKSWRWDLGFQPFFRRCFPKDGVYFFVRLGGCPKSSQMMVFSHSRASSQLNSGVIFRCVTNLHLLSQIFGRCEKIHMDNFWCCDVHSLYKDTSKLSYMTKHPWNILNGF